MVYDVVDFFTAPLLLCWGLFARIQSRSFLGLILVIAHAELTGRNDTITPPEVADEFKALLPDADLYWIDECGHAPMMEHPEPFNRILSDWYERRGILS